jgi:hypothetical protein
LVCHAQTPKTDQPTLSDVRARYDAPFSRNLQSFDCAVEFSWKDHFKETTRVGDEGTDEELETIFQPIQNRITVTADKVTVSSGSTDDAISKLPHGGMAEFLLEHAVQRGLYTWLPASTNQLLPDPATPVHFEPTASGYNLTFKLQNFNIEMLLTSDMRLQNMALKAPQPEHIETEFIPGPQGFLLTSWNMGEDGFAPGSRLVFTYSYQTVDGVQLPEHVVVNRESHHEIWRFKLTGCTVKTSK